MADPTKESSERDHSPRGAADGHPVGDEAEFLPPAILAKLPDFALEIYMRVRPTGGGSSNPVDDLRHLHLCMDRATQASGEAFALLLSAHRMQQTAELVMKSQSDVAGARVRELLDKLFDRGGKRS